MKLEAGYKRKHVQAVMKQLERSKMNLWILFY